MHIRTDKAFVVSHQYTYFHRPCASQRSNQASGLSNSDSTHPDPIVNWHGTHGVVM